MNDIWYLADIEEERFAAAAALFASHTQQQSIRRPALIPPSDDEDNSSEEEFDDEWRTTVACEKLHRATGRPLKDRFLDRLSEVLAREKTSNSRPRQSTAKHVAAAAWVSSNCDSPMTIMLAKNEGLDERDRRLLGRLQTWLRAISATGKTPSKENDLLWDSRADEEGLIGYSQCRLEVYVSQIGQCKLDVSRLGVDNPSTGQMQRLLRLCGTYSTSPRISALKEVVDLAYELRCADWRRFDKTSFSKTLKAVFMLGRLRAAYECFKTTALSFPEFGSLEWRLIESPHKVDIDVTRFCKQVQNLAKIIGRKRLVKGSYAQRYRGTSLLHVHAEMQIFVNLESKSKWRQRVHPYIGTSKKPCFLCNEVLQNYVRLSANGIRTTAFRARMSHGKVYPLWTLPHIPVSAESSVGLSVAAVLIQIHRYVLEALSADFVELQPAIAESSAGMSENVLFSGTIPSKLKLEYLARERSAAASTPVVELDEDDHTFGPKVKTVQVFRIPADGSEPRLVHIAFHAQRLESKRKVPEFGFYLVPDFREFWASYHLDRKFARCTVENQPIEEIEGNYWVYRNGNPDLPENAYIKRMLGIDRVDHSRQFYYGDVFIVRFTEHSKTFAYTVDNIPSASSPSLIAVLKVLFQHEWESAFIESELRDDQYFEEQELKLETDKKILYQRMTPIERELLKRMPPNTLEILAIQSCDDDALVGASVGQSDDPDMVTIKTMRRPRALDLMGWSGFQSSQL